MEYNLIKICCICNDNLMHRILGMLDYNQQLSRYKYIHMMPRGRVVYLEYNLFEKYCICNGKFVGPKLGMLGLLHILLVSHYRYMSKFIH
jgi:hypothetical protein